MTNSYYKRISENSFREKASLLGVKLGYAMDDLFSFFFSKKSSWRLCNAYSQTLRLHSSDIFCFSLHLWIPI
jgi:hypothetical protein